MAPKEREPSGEYKQTLSDDDLERAINIGMEEPGVGVASTSRIKDILHEEMDIECSLSNVNRRLNDIHDQTLNQPFELEKVKPGSNEVFWGIKS